MFKIQVTEYDEVIGHMSVEDFRRYVRPSSREFLNNTVEKFNQHRKSIDDPTRVKVVFD